ncbi:MAG TPA: glycosyltransferase family 87 protein [Solirubrobacterales bacterium]
MSEPDSGVSTPVLILLIWLAGASGCLLVYLGSKLTFFLDDWEFLLYRRGFNAESILDPHGEHIVVAPVLIYKALLATLGMGSALPFRVVSTALFLLSAVLLFVCLRRRVGQWPALAATAIVLFLGAAWEDLLWSFQMGYFGGMAAGLGALLAIEREDTRGDVLACLLLVVSILFSSLGLPFAIGLAVAILRRPDRWRRLYIVAIPLGVYALWWLGWGHTAESAFSLSNLAKTPLFVLNSIAAAMASLFGLATPTVDAGAGGLEWGRPLAVLAIFLALWRAYRLEKVSARFWMVLTIAGSFWILAGLNQMPGRDPTSSRYQYVDVIFVLLIAAELLRGIRIEERVARRAVAVVLALAVASIASNLYYLTQAYNNGYHPISRLEKASLGAVEVARDTVEPGFVLSEELTGTGYVHVDAQSYLSARDAFGSPAYDPAEIAAAAPVARFAADKVLFAALRIGLAPVPGSLTPFKPPPRALPGPPITVSVPVGSCISVGSNGSSSPLLRLPRTGGRIEAGSDPIEKVKLTRFAAGEFPIELAEAIAPHRAAELRIPPDRSNMPWRMQLETGSSTTVCGGTSPE